MKTNKLLVLSLMLTTFILAGCAQTTSTSTPDTSAAQTHMNNEFTSITTGSTGQGDVSIELTPVLVTENRIEISFTANTHSVDLSDFDLFEIALLEFNRHSIRPVSAPNLQGHHVKGVMMFEVPEKPDEFTITISGIPKEQERVYSWKVA